MKSIAYLSIFSFVLTFCVSGCFAESEGDNQRLDLAALIQEGIRNNPEIRFYEGELEAARAMRLSAGRWGVPEVSGNVGQKKVRSVGGDLAGEGVAWGVGVSQTLEWPGRLGLRKAIANQDIDLAALGLQRFQHALAVRIRSGVVSLMGLRAKARVAAEVADRYRSLREVLVQRDPAGISPQLELRILEATELGLRRRVTEAQLGADEAGMSLNLLLGRPVAGVLEVREVPFELPELRPLEEWLGAALTNNFDLRVRGAELEQQGFRVALARNERWPAIKVGPQFSEENAGGQDRIFGIGVTVPLPLWRNNSSNISLARARQSQAEVTMAVTRRDLEHRVVRAFHGYEVRRRELSQWNPDSVRQFEESAVLADRHYRLGAVPAAVYVEIQKQYLDAIETLFDTRLQALEAVSELEDLSGLRLLSIR